MGVHMPGLGPEKFCDRCGRELKVQRRDFYDPWNGTKRTRVARRWCPSRLCRLDKALRTRP